MFYLIDIAQWNICTQVKRFDVTIVTTMKWKYIMLYTILIYSTTIVPSLLKLSVEDNLTLLMA